MTSDKQHFVDNRESKDVVLESDGKNTYCISEYNEEEDEEEEEGLEVIGLGRYNTMMTGDDTATESFKVEMLRLAESNDSLEVDDRLSQMFASSSPKNNNNNRIKVAYYRPSLDDDHDNTTDKS